MVRIKNALKQLNRNKLSWKDRALVITAVGSMLIALSSLGINYWVGKQNLKNFDKQFKQNQVNFEKEFNQRYRPYLHISTSALNAKLAVRSDTGYIKLSDSLRYCNYGWNPLWIDSTINGTMNYKTWNDTLGKSTQAFIDYCKKAKLYKDYLPDRYILKDSTRNIFYEFEIGFDTSKILFIKEIEYVDTLYIFNFVFYHDLYNNLYNTLSIAHLIIVVNQNKDGSWKASARRAAIETYRLDLPFKDD